jgi:hypothetical protein
VQVEDQVWMAYIDAELRSVCHAKGWRHQIRRKWAVREQPVADSTLEDYEWKLVPSDARGSVAGAADDSDFGTYYVVRLGHPRGTFVLQHDTSHCGVRGAHWERTTFTEIARQPLLQRSMQEEPGPPPAGWLRDHLLELTGSFGPNHFSAT